MKIETTAKLASILLFGSSLAAIGCESSARSTTTTGPVVPAEMIVPVEEKKADVDVQIGGGQGIQVDVDRDGGPLRRERADVDVDIGGGGGIRVDVDK